MKYFCSLMLLIVVGLCLVAAWLSQRTEIPALFSQYSHYQIAAATAPETRLPVVTMRGMIVGIVANRELAEDGVHLHIYVAEPFARRINKRSIAFVEDGNLVVRSTKSTNFPRLPENSTIQFSRSSSFQNRFLNSLDDLDINF
ncbi:hypothetical protein [Pseudodesulfovibrio sp.]|uniref:hypothetical protein n=1 Tax=unclassified Pseudodesulfovibrio TaxID=2661612 RepID=UPI003B008351